MQATGGDNGDDSELVAGKAVAHEKELVADLEKININDLSSVEEEYINDPFQVSDDDEDEQNDNSTDRSNDAIFNLMSFSDSRVKIQDLVKKATRTPPRNRDTRVSPRSQNVKQLNSAVRTLNTLLDDLHNDAFNSEGPAEGLHTNERVVEEKKDANSSALLASPSQQRFDEHEQGTTPEAPKSNFSMTNEDVVSIKKAKTNNADIDESYDLDNSTSSSVSPGTILDKHSPENRLEMLKKEVSYRPS